MAFELVQGNKLSKRMQETISDVVARIVSLLGTNLQSIVLYGSAVRGGFVDGRSDVNLLFVLKISTAAAQAELGKVLADSKLPVTPFTLGLQDLDNSMRCFAIKFRSIQRHYTVLHGADPFENFSVDADLLKLLLGQSLRNLHLRLTQSFIKSYTTPGRYRNYLNAFLVTLVVDLSDVARLKEIKIPDDFVDRIPILEQNLPIPCTILSELIALKQYTKKTWHNATAEQDLGIHHRLLQLMESVIGHLESL
jgi:predicted nucleotidyltransferase